MSETMTTKLSPDVRRKAGNLYTAMLSKANDLSVWDKAQLFACMNRNKLYDDAPEAIQVMFAELVVRAEL